VLVLVTRDELVQQPVAHAAGGRQLGYALAHGLQVLPRLRAVQVGELAALRPRSLEGVVHLRKLAAQHPLATETVHEPQILEGGDVTEVPDQRAHQRRVHALHVAFGDRIDQRQRLLARGLQRAQCLAGRALGGGGGGGHPEIARYGVTRSPDQDSQTQTLTGP